MTIRLLHHTTEDYQQMIHLRKKILLDPIGVPESFINREKEKEDMLIGAFDKEQMIGCCVLTPIDSYTVQLRQMAVDSSYQGKGVGKKIIDFAEKAAVSKGFKNLMMHARDEAVPFYEKSGYSVIGDSFSEVGILHFKMQKILS